MTTFQNTVRLRRRRPERATSVDKSQFLALGQPPPYPDTQQPRDSPEFGPVVHVVHGQKQTKLAVADLVATYTSDPEQLGQHPHGLAVDRNLAGIVPLELAIAALVRSGSPRGRP